MRTLLFLLLLAPAAYAQTFSWTLQTSGTTADLHDVFFTSHDTGYVTGDTTLLLRTTDGGLTWSALPAAPHNGTKSQAIWMFNSSTGMLTPDYMGNTPLRTTNGGQNWSGTPSQAGNPCFPDGFFFASPTEGFIYGTGCFGGCYVARWNGSGWATEEMVYYGVTPSSTTIGIKGMAKDPVNNVYVVVGDYGKIFRSTNGFQTWDTLALADTVDFTAVDYVGNNTFVASSKSQFNCIYISTDDGLTFAPDPNFALTFFYPEFYDVDMVANGFGVAGGIAQTGGTGFLQWRDASSGWGGGGYQPVPYAINAVFVIDSANAFAVGDSGQIYRWGLSTGIGVNEYSTETLAIFPNVLTREDALTLNLPGNAVWQLEIYNAAGQRVCSKSNVSGKTILPVNGFANSTGMYFCRVADAQGNVRTGKVLVR